MQESFAASYNRIISRIGPVKVCQVCFYFRNWWRKTLRGFVFLELGSQWVWKRRARDCTCHLHQNDINVRERYVVYQVTCTSCDNMYIGETTRPVISRMREHESSTRLGNRRTPLGEHLLDEHPHLVSGGAGHFETSYGYQNDL
eukprot:sb/3473979/